MEYQKFENKYVLRLDKGEEVISSITKFCKNEDVRLGSIVGLGASNEVTIGLFDVVNKKYHKKTLKESLEITSLVGNISRMNNEVYLHIHINVCNEDMMVFGGHLNECYISATSEIVIDTIKGEVDREYNDDVGLNLYKFLK